MQNFILEFNNFKVSIEPDSLTPKVKRRLINQLEEARESFLKDFNSKIDKALEINKEYEEPLKKKEDESNEEFDIRFKTLIEERDIKLKELDGEEGAGSTTGLHYETLKLISKIGNKEVTREEFDDLPIWRINDFLYKILKHLKLQFADQFVNE